MNKWMAFAVGAWLLFSGMKCRVGDTPECFLEYKFRIGMTVTPARDTFRIGDTLWLESEIPAELEDSLSGKLMDVSQFDFHVRAAVARQDTVPFFPGEPHFAYIFEKGRLEFKILPYTIHTSVIYETAESGVRRLRVGMVCRKKGVFYLAFYNLTDDTKGVLFANSDCIETLRVDYLMNNGADNHFHILENVTNPGPTEEVFNGEGGYAFKVI